MLVAGAFHSVKPSDLLAELQGRLPIRVELKPLNEGDLYRVMTETENNLIRQQVALMAAYAHTLAFLSLAWHCPSLIPPFVFASDNVKLSITDAAIKEIAKGTRSSHSRASDVDVSRGLYGVV